MASSVPPPKDPWAPPPPFYALYAPSSLHGPPPAPPPIPAEGTGLCIFGLNVTSEEVALVPDLKTEQLFSTRPDGSTGQEVPQGAAMMHACTTHKTDCLD